MGLAACQSGDGSPVALHPLNSFGFFYILLKIVYFQAFNEKILCPGSRVPSLAL